mmetsp:Transcript_603/g.728  ORF Transcript_603/g.728 Transcript_603/m.728 type:complete len:87 (+) Transcript_603:458-718(+)
MVGIPGEASRSWVVREEEDKNEHQKRNKKLCKLIETNVNPPVELETKKKISIFRRGFELFKAIALEIKIRGVFSKCRLRRLYFWFV